MEELMQKAEAGDAEAQLLLGMAYYKGNRIEKSQVKALKWWTKAAEQGVEDADYCLGCIYFDKKKFSIAYKCYLKAIKDPLINEAGFQLGVIYENGLGVEIDKDKAIEYYKMGAAGLNMASNLSTDALKRLGAIHSWADLGISHQKLCENAKYRFNESWNELITSFSLFHSGIWLKIHLKE